MLNVIGFAFIVWELRPSAATEPDEYLLGAVGVRRGADEGG